MIKVKRYALAPESRDYKHDKHSGSLDFPLVPKELQCGKRSYPAVDVDKNLVVVPAFRGKGVSFDLYHTAFNNSLKKGYTWGEGSTIGETNLRMRADIEKAGAQHYKTYRIYRKEL
jgi:GNAT superfamily N-acetyltransferase